MENSMTKIEELKELRDSNMISEADLQKKKQEIASKTRHQPWRSTSTSQKL